MTHSRIAAHDLANGLGTDFPRCYWHNDVNDDFAVGGAPSAIGPDASADIIIVGGGFAGLATACRIAERQPDAKVVLLEANKVGFGASGRNGGLVSPLAAPVWLAGALHNGRQADALRMLYRQSQAAAEWAREHAPDAEVRRTDLVIAAQGPLTAAGLSEVADVIVKSGIPAQQSHARNRPTELRLGTYTIHPYKLAIGLAAYARRLGVSICEQIPVKSIEPASSGTAVHLASGKSILAKTVVIAANAYSGSIEMPGRPAGKVVRNFMVATKPLTDTQLALLAHSDDFVVELNRKYIFYRVHERRLVFGGIDKVGAPKTFNDFEIPGDVRQSLQRELMARLGGDRDVEIEFGWGGRFHMTMTDLPIIERISTHPSVIYNAGYGGTGVALTLALAPVAAALALSQPVKDDELGHVAQVMRETRLPVRGGLALAAGVTRRIFSQLLTRDG